MIALYAYGLTRKRIESKLAQARSSIESRADYKSMTADQKKKFMDKELEKVVMPGSDKHRALWQKELERALSTKDISISESLNLKTVFAHLFEFDMTRGSNVISFASRGPTRSRGKDPEGATGNKDPGTPGEGDPSEPSPEEPTKPPENNSGGGRPSSVKSGPAHVYDKISADGKKYIVGRIFESKRRRAELSLFEMLLHEAPDDAPLDFDALWKVVNTKENQINKTPDQLIQKAQASYTSKGEVTRDKASDGLEVRGSDVPEDKQEALLKKYSDISKEITKILNARKMFVSNGTEVKWDQIPKVDSDALQAQLKAYQAACKAYVQGNGAPELIKRIDPNAIATLSKGWKFTPTAAPAGEVQATKEGYEKSDALIFERWQKLAGMKII